MSSIDTIKGSFLKWKGSYKIITRKGIFVRDNLIMNLAFDELIKAFYSNTNLTYRYIAIGEDNGTILPLAATNTALGDEVYRIPVVSKLRTGTGELTSRATLTADEPNYLLIGSGDIGDVNIEEIGLFAGNALPWDGGAGKDTGLLVSRILWRYSKESTEEIRFERVDKIS